MTIQLVKLSHVASTGLEKQALRIALTFGTVHFEGLKDYNV
jgi:hypothetical protein